MLIKGNIILSSPFLPEEPFHKSVVYLTEHSPEGSVGFILNKKLDITLKNIIPELESDFDLYMGGPVETDMLYFIHTLGERIEGSFPIGENIYWGGDFFQMKREILRKEATTENVRFFLGYSGWDSGQLEAEMRNGYWIEDPDYSFSLNMHKTRYLWESRIKNLGQEFALWVNQPENPALN